MVGKTVRRIRRGGGVPAYSHGRWARLAAALLLALPVASCSRKLSRGGNAMEVLTYDILKMDRSTSDYYRTVQEAHDHCDYCYRCTDDTYLADKSVDAVYRLGDAKYDRLEGEVQVILELSDIVFEAKVALERANAAGSLTRLASRLGAESGARIEDRGDVFLSRLKELDGMHDPQTGALLRDSPAIRQRMVQIVDEIGSYRFPNAALDKNALRWFPARVYVVNETDPTLRAAYDRAMRRRSWALIVSTLVGAIQDPSPHVRQVAIEGLYSLGVTVGGDAVLDRLPNENAPFVRAAAADYLVTIGGARSADALITLLRDDDGGVRRRARKSLTQLAGRDLGGDSAAWQEWATKTFPAAEKPAGREAASATPDRPR